MRHMPPIVFLSFHMNLINLPTLTQPWAFIDLICNFLILTMFT